MTGTPARRTLQLMRLVGARPQFMQAAPLSRELRQRGHVETLVHTGQHYDDNMSRQFFRDLELRDPDVNLNIGSGGHGVQTGRMLAAVEECLARGKFDAVVVDGDTNTTLAGALAAAKLHVPVVHIEAGMRCFDRTMPEEINRVLTDHISTLLCAPTETAEQNLAREGILQGVVRTGDLMYDCFLQYRQKAKTEVLDRLDIRSKQYILATIHREENADNPQRVQEILRALTALPLPVIFPVHPRTRPKVEAWLAGGESLGGVRLIGPVGYLEMLALEMHARCVLTDSGGVQREAFFAGVPAVILREITEWCEIAASGWGRLAGTGTAAILAAFAAMEALHAQEPPSPQPIFGDGHAATRIALAIEEALA